MWLLWLLFSGFAVTCTIFLSLDTTAVLLTPVALAVANQIGVPPRPFRRCRRTRGRAPQPPAQSGGNRHHGA